MTKLQLFANAMSYYGEKETHGGLTNEKILYFLTNTTGIEIKKNMPWCAGFVNSVLKDSGFNHSDSLIARSFLRLGRSTLKPKLGDVAVFWRGNKTGWKGHVGFYVKENNNVIYVLGGNQDNKVCIKAYSKNQLLSYRSIGLKK